MKRLIIITRILVLWLAFFLSTTYSSWAVVEYKCYIKNIVQTAPNVLEFDVWLENVGTDTLHHFFIQCGIKFNYSGMLNGGTMTPLFVPGSADPNLPPPQQTASVQINATSQQFRVAATVPGTGMAGLLAALKMPTPPGFRVGTFRITNSVPFTANSSPNFLWEFVSSPTTTATGVGAYVNSVFPAVNVTIPSNHFVLGNPTLNPSAITSTIQAGSTGQQICKGDAAYIRVNVSGGVPPYTVVYTDGSTNYTENNYITGTDIAVPSTNSATYSVVSITDATGFSSVGSSSSTTITVVPLNKLVLSANNNQNSIVGSSTVTNVHPDGSNILYKDTDCKIMASISDTLGGDILGTLTVKTTVEPNVNVVNTKTVCKRWFDVTTPAIMLPPETKLTFYLTQQDFDDYNAVSPQDQDLPLSGNNADPFKTRLRVLAIDNTLINGTLLTPTNVNWNSTLGIWEITCYGFPTSNRYYITSVEPSVVDPPASILFTGRKLTTSDQLNWVTSDEKGISHFILMYSTDNVNYNPLLYEFSKSGGFSTTPLAYSRENQNPKEGHNYYRLYLVDTNGNFYVHKETVDLVWDRTGTSVSIYPNSNGNFNIDVSTAAPKDVTVKVYDMSGRIVRELKARSENGVSYLQIDMRGFAKGIYVFKVFTDNSLITSKKVSN